MSPWRKSSRTFTSTNLGHAGPPAGQGPAPHFLHGGRGQIRHEQRHGTQDGAVPGQSGAISGQQLDTAIRDVSHGSRLGQKLVNLGFVTAEQLNAALQDLVCSIITEAMGWFQGLYRLTLKEAPSPRTSPSPFPPPR